MGHTVQSMGVVAAKLGCTLPQGPNLSDPRAQIIISKLKFTQYHCLAGDLPTISDVKYVSYSFHLDFFLLSLLIVCQLNFYPCLSFHRDVTTIVNMDLRGKSQTQSYIIKCAAVEAIFSSARWVSIDIFIMTVKPKGACNRLEKELKEKKSKEVWKSKK